MASRLDSLKRFTPYVPIAVAAVVGIILGLLIGWVWWPVTWTNAWVVDLSPAQKAAYISAVADAYVLDGGQSATLRMEQRLAPFGADLSDALVGAMQHYQSDPAANSVVLGNIGRLATDLGVQVDASLMAAEAAETAPPTGSEEILPDAAAAVVEAAMAEESSGTGILTWLLAVLASLALIGGGIYLLLRLRASQVPESLTGPSPVPGAAPAKRSTNGAAENGGSRTSAWSRPPTDPDNELSFEDEDDEEPAVRFGGLPDDDLEPDIDPTLDPRIALEDDPEQEDDQLDPTAPPRYSTARYSGGGMETVERHTASPDAGRGSAPALTTGDRIAFDQGAADRYAAESRPVAELTRDEDPPADLDAFAAHALGVAMLPPGVEPAQPSSRTAPARASTRSATRSAAAPIAPAQPPAARGVPFASYTFQFHAGMPDYIEAQTLTEPGSSRYIGECGMAVSSKNPVLHNDPDQVVALEVWLYDKMEARENTNTTRVLLSEYADDRDLAQTFAKAGDGTVRTFVAQPGTRFQLDGHHLLLDGTITEVEYDLDGIFRKVTVEMDLLAKQ